MKRIGRSWEGIEKLEAERFLVVEILFSLFVWLLSFFILFLSSWGPRTCV
jgi:hypothetical protein